MNRSWQATSPSATQKFPNTLWNLLVHYRVRKSPPPVPALSKIYTPPYRALVSTARRVLRLQIVDHTQQAVQRIQLAHDRAQRRSPVNTRRDPRNV
jgi:hypothetical protein